MTMRLESIHNVVSKEVRKVDNLKKESTSAKSTTYTRKADNTNLSSDAKSLNDTKASASVVSARVQAEPDVRADKINEVRRKLDEGYYNSSKFTDQLADKLIKDFGL